MTVTPDDVLTYWFGAATLTHLPDDAHRKRWFSGGAAVDDEIRARFSETLAQARAGALARWRDTPAGALALVVVLDQFSRNLHRGTAAAFASDAQALQISLGLLDSGLDREAYGFFQRLFLYTPLEHAEDLGMQRRCVVEMARLLRDTDEPEVGDWPRQVLDYALQHHDIIARFGRYPHRNAACGRESTDEEAAWLEESGVRFGQ